MNHRPSSRFMGSWDGWDVAQRLEHRLSVARFAQHARREFCVGLTHTGRIRNTHLPKRPPRSSMITLGTSVVQLPQLGGSGRDGLGRASGSLENPPARDDILHEPGHPWTTSPVCTVQYSNHEPLHRARSPLPLKLAPAASLCRFKPFAAYSDTFTSEQPQANILTHIEGCERLALSFLCPRDQEPPLPTKIDVQRTIIPTSS